MSKKYLFVKWSSGISPNVIDWIRSIYFSLLGSSMLTFSLKYSTLSICSFIIFAIGVLAFLFGLLVSVIIANRFKRYEKNYDGLPETTKLIKNTETYYYEQEIDLKHNLLTRAQHFFFYILWIPALLCIGDAGFYMESKSAKSGSETKKVLDSVVITVKKLDSVLQKISNNGMEKKLLQDLLHSANIDIERQEKQIDSLKKAINTLTPKSGTK